MKAIKYIGSKEHGVKDTICGTGLAWGHGETLAVTDEQAEKLLTRPELWEIDGEAKTEQLSGLESASAEPKDKDDEEEDFGNPPPQNLSAMTNKAIAEYAMREHNLQFEAKTTKPQMIEQLNNKIGSRVFN